MSSPAILEFSTPIPVTTPVGTGHALFVECDNHVQYWTIIMDDCSFVTLPQDKIRACRSYTHGRGITHEEMRGILERARAKEAKGPTSSLAQCGD